MTQRFPGQRWDAWGWTIVLAVGTWAVVTLLFAITRPDFEAGTGWWSIPVLVLVGVVKVWRSLTSRDRSDDRRDDDEHG